MQIVRKTVAGELARLRTARGLAARAASVGDCAMFLCACNTDQQVTAGAPDVPYDYRQRHPITMTEGDQTLQVFVGTSRGELNAGQRGTFRIHVLNRGPNVALKVRIVDDVDPRLELLSASTNRGGCSTSGQRVTCRIAALPPGARVVVVVAFRARAAGTIRNTAAATHSRPDPTPGNNVDSAVITVIGRTGAVSPAFTG